MKTNFYRSSVRHDASTNKVIYLFCLYKMKINMRSPSSSSSSSSYFLNVLFFLFIHNIHMIPQDFTIQKITFDPTFIVRKYDTLA